MLLYEWTREKHNSSSSRTRTRKTTKKSTTRNSSRRTEEEEKKKKKKKKKPLKIKFREERKSQKRIPVSSEARCQGFSPGTPVSSPTFIGLMVQPIKIKLK